MLPLFQPTYSWFASSIKSSIAINSVPLGKSIHAQIIKLGYLSQITLSNHLLNLYSKSHYLEDTRKLFDEMPERNLISYSTLISAYSRSKDLILALQLVSKLRSEALEPNQFVFSSSIAACSRLDDAVGFGRELHAQAMASGFGSDVFVRTALIDLYSKFGDPVSAVSVFQQGPVNDAVLLNSMVSGYVSFGSYEEGLRLFEEARRDSWFKPTESTFSSLVKACSELNRETGEQLHGVILKTGFDTDCFIGTSLVNMYGNYGDVDSMEIVFEGVSFTDVALYNAMIVGSCKNDYDEIALEYFTELRHENFVPNDRTFSSIVKACGVLRSSKLGRMVHGLVEKSRYRQDLVVSTALIDMYMKCGQVEESSMLFDRMHERNTVSYNVMIYGHGLNENYHEAVTLFADMNRKQLDVHHVTFIALMSACMGHEWSVYVHAVKHGFGSDLLIQSALLDSLIKQGAAEEAVELFDKMEVQNIVSWTTIISGMTQLNRFLDALKLFKTMIASSSSPNNFTFSSVFKACGSLPSLEQGRCIHGCSIKHGVMDEFTKSSLLDMYSKCGILEDSRRLFNELRDKDIVSWNAMVTGYAHHGYVYEALELYAGMEEHGIHPNHVTFVSLLSACSRCGLVENGIRLFQLMLSKHQLSPSMEHYVCMVDLFGRAGMLEKAKCFIMEMPFKADALVWTVFLAACKLHGNVDLAKLAREHVLRIRGEEDKATLVLISNVYSAVGQWIDAEKARNGMTFRETGKEPGLSWLQISEKPLFSEGVT